MTKRKSLIMQSLARRFFDAPAGAGISRRCIVSMGTIIAGYSATAIVVGEKSNGGEMTAEEVVETYSMMMAQYSKPANYGFFGTDDRAQRNSMKGVHRGKLFSNFWAKSFTKN